jgi:DTW domain-containing protein
METQVKKIDKKQACPGCLRPVEQCFCDKVKQCDNKIEVLILQHPQEQYKIINSAMLAHKILKNSNLKVGLSWRNFSHALGRDVDLKKWGVLFLKGSSGKRPLECTDSKKRTLPRIPELDGIVVIDGSWKQAKTIWWRNPWLLRLIRITLNPQAGSLRTQTKKEGLSTIEAIEFAFKYIDKKAVDTGLIISQYKDLIIKPNVLSPLVV